MVSFCSLEPLLCFAELLRSESSVSRILQLLVSLRSSRSQSKPTADIAADLDGGRGGGAFVRP